MKTYNTLYKDFTTLSLYMNEHAIKDHPNWFIRIHTGVHTKESIRPLLAWMKENMPSAHILGSSNPAVIYNAEIRYDECLISFTYIDNAKLMSHFYHTDNKSPQELADEIEQTVQYKNAKAAVIFMNNNYHQVSDFIEKCNSFSAKIKSVGGVCFPRTSALKGEVGFVFYGDEVSEDGLVITLIYHDHLYCYSNANLGIEQIGQGYTITKTDGLNIEEIDHKDASLWYRTMLGKDSFEKDPDICKLFPFVLPDQQFSIRTIAYNCENQKLHWYDNPKDNQQIRLGYCSPSVVVQECKSICKDLAEQPVETLFAYSCVTRNEIMNKCCSWELSPLANTTISGALCGGEFCNINDANVYGNSTCSIMSLATDPNARIDIIQEALDQVDTLGYDNQHILTYLLKSANEDMYRTNNNLSRQILEQNDQMLEALFVDPGTKLPNLTRYLYDLEHIGYNKMCIISTQNATMLRSHYGDELCTREIFAKIQRCKEFLEDNELHFYQHNQDCIMICASPTYDDQVFLNKIKSLFTYLGTMEAKENNFYYVNEFAVVINETNLLEKAELTLSSIAHSLQRFLVYYPNLGLETQVEEEIQYLAHIKYALLHDKVEPFFQPIHDNELHTIQRFESLMRIHTKDGNILYPGQFMDIAKKFKLYQELSRQMITKVMKLFKDSEESVTINLSTQDIDSQQTKSLIYQLLSTCKHPDNIIFEIVESEEIHKNDDCLEFITNVRKYGAKIAIDDFGAGYSNLLKLVKLNADYIKIDGEIICNMLVDDTCQKIIDTILFLSDIMKTELVAEFVESKDIQQQIEKLGIRYSQGYHFSKPKPYKEICIKKENG